MKILSISHYDLDGFGCQLSILEKFKNHQVTLDNCGYGKIIDTIKKYDFNDYDLVFITDLNFNEEQQKFLKEKVKNYNGKFVYIDHHLYDTKKYLDFDKIIIDTTKSASLKTFEILKIENEKLKKLIEIIDIYDLWKVDNPKFKFANYFNTYFWKYSDTFIYRMQKINYDISLLKDELKQIYKEVKNYFKNNKLIFQFKNVLVTYSFDYVNHLEEYYPTCNFFIMVNLDSNRISFKDKIGIRNKIQNVIEKYNGEFGGHEFAYGCVIPNLSSKYKEIVKKLISVSIQ